MKMNRVFRIACAAAFFINATVVHAVTKESVALQKEEQRVIEAALYQRHLKAKMQDIALRPDYRTVSSYKYDPVDYRY
jgi:hypothetical protein